MYSSYLNIIKIQFEICVPNNIPRRLWKISTVQSPFDEINLGGYVWFKMALDTFLGTALVKRENFQIPMSYRLVEFTHYSIYLK